ncbi:hypothetical protein GIB67_028830 [Kingdonia uniflora]|uniref:Fe2OG dioxygenase domain-containing protein n=1 Tax=Kingdonia uniflora TaxID=39325 RepID=A0A7J7LT50_9MAGN|nr:hypothetical protein GIB67_028830 [Kingdonia uniflora]
MVGMRVIFGLLTFVTVGMIIGALFQLAFIRKFEESSGIPRWTNDKDAHILRLGIVKPEIISWSPRIIVLHEFLSNEECDYLRAVAKPRLQISTVVDAKTGKALIYRSSFSYLNSKSIVGIKSNVRTSSGMFLSSTERKFPIVQAIEERIALYSQVPKENGELIQVLKYEASQFYKPHHDYFADTYNLNRGGQRIATVLMYLSDAVEGGETYFPLAGSGECSCGGKVVNGISVKPVKGDAVLFWSMGLDGQSDPKSVHGGCEVLAGEKWSATKWMRQRSTF